MYQRSIDEIEKRAARWWPDALKSKDVESSIVPRLVESQDKFLSILNLCTDDPFRVFDLLRTTEFPANLFLKHLSVLADYGGEPMQRLGRSFESIFPKKRKKHYFEFSWCGQSYRYVFRALPVRALGNKKLHIDGVGLIKNQPLDDLAMDMIAILLFASTSDVAELAGLDACEIGSLLGRKDLLMEYVKQRYIFVSKITSGAKANHLGQLAQDEVLDYLNHNLGEEYSVIRNGTIKLGGYSKEGGMPFDIVVERGSKKAGIEISFQVTTNSTIERKAGQAADRQMLMHEGGYSIGYVIDGAGNFQRASAISTICNYSDCTVAYTEAEFKVLARWVREVL